MLQRSPHRADSGRPEVNGEKLDCLLSPRCLRIASSIPPSPGTADPTGTHSPSPQPASTAVSSALLYFRSTFLSPRPRAPRGGAGPPTTPGSDSPPPSSLADGSPSPESTTALRTFFAATLFSVRLLCGLGFARNLAVRPLSSSMLVTSLT